MVTLLLPFLVVQLLLMWKKFYKQPNSCLIGHLSFVCLSRCEMIKPLCLLELAVEFCTSGLTN